MARNKKESSKKDSLSELPEIQKYAIDKGRELSLSIYNLSCLGKAWLKKAGRSGLEHRINEVQKQLDSIFDEIRTHADALGFPLTGSTPRGVAEEHQH